MKNNKGVTLVELLVVIVVMGIIAGFAIPAVGGIIENANKDSVLNDAIQVENAARLYCSTNNCGSGTQTLTWGAISEYIEGLEGTYSETSGGTIAYRDANGDWGVKLTGGGGYTFPASSTETYVSGDTDSNDEFVHVPQAVAGGSADEVWLIPSESTRDQVS